MAFPAIVPSQRTYDPGDWPIKTYASISGREVRIRYGDTRTNARLELSYSNISDATAELFMAHFVSTKGTFSSFTLPTETSQGWTGGGDVFTAGGSEAKFRYEKAPQIASVRPGISSVTVSLVGVI